MGPFDYASAPSLSEFVQRLFTSDFMPHGHCFFWRPDILWLHVLSDLFIGLAYFIIPFALLRFVKQRHDLVFNWMFLLFAVFIMACGTTHLFEIWTMWHGTYRLEGIVKLITAVVSMATAILLWPLIPKALTLKSPADLEKEVQERTQELKRTNQLLSDATRELERNNLQLLRSNEELERFAYVASHDLQEPLRVISNYNSLIEERYGKSLDSDGRTFLRFSTDAAHRMRTLIEDLLSFSRLSQAPQHTEPTDLADVIDEASADLKIMIQETGTVIEYDTLPKLVCSRSRMKRVFQNLLTNAIKFRSERPPRIRITAERKEDEWLLRVADNGMGIDSRHLERIFVIFQRLHNRKDYPGTGMGLTITKKIIEQNGGRIWVESEKGKGTAFYFTLPAKDIQEDTSDAATGD